MPGHLCSAGSYAGAASYIYWLPAAAASGVTTTQHSLKQTYVLVNVIPRNRHRSVVVKATATTDEQVGKSDTTVGVDSSSDVSR